MTQTVTTKPKSKQSKYMKRWQVLALCKSHAMGEYSMRTMFPPDCPARKRFPNCAHDVYVRAVVLEVLGLSSDD